MLRQLNFQPIAWFWDLYQRRRLDMDPPYQRRSVWNLDYRQYFIDTIVNSYPAPAIFLYQEISLSGDSKYSVVDGKQRLTTIFEFVTDEFPTLGTSKTSELANKRFSQLPDAIKAEFWRYLFAVESLPSTDEHIIGDIFDRINRNTARLTEQELRHARFSGEFITEAEQLVDYMASTLPANFPNIAPQSRRQMKDVEFVAELLLLLEQGPQATSQADLDDAFNERDGVWERREDITGRFRNVVEFLRSLFADEQGAALTRTRLRNQGDFYSLFGAIDSLARANYQFFIPETVNRLQRFTAALDEPKLRNTVKELAEYYDAVKFYSNTTGPRRTRSKVMELLLHGDLDGRF